MMTQGCLRKRNGRGLTLLEMSVAMAVSSVMFLAIANVLASNHKSFNRTYDRVNGNLANDAYTARLLFDRIMRKASTDDSYTTCTTTSVKVGYYSANSVTTPDCGAIFYLSGTTLKLARGALTVTTSSGDPVIARNVKSCTFEQMGPCIAMALVLDDGTTDQTIAVTATRHNE